MPAPRTLRALAPFLLLALASGLSAGDAVKSGPQSGALLPGPFDPLNLNGDKKGRPHCLVCEYALNPVVMVFAREPAEGKDGPLTELLKKLDEAVPKYREPELKAFVVFLSKEAKSSADDAKAGEQEELVEEAMARAAMIARLTARAEGLKNVIASVYPVAGPKGYNVSDKAEVTVVFYQRHRVLANWAFAEEKLTTEDVDAVLKKVDQTLSKEAKKGAKKG